MEENRYTKEELKESKRFKGRVDLIQALLQDGLTYSVEEAEEIIKEFMEGSV